MDNIDIANGLVFKQLGIEKDTFDERLISQKKVYLLQALGTDLGYHYNWYLRGPYSPVLTSYMYANLDWLKDSNTELADYRLSCDAENNIRCVNEMTQQSSSAGLTESAWYELLASLHYIYQNKRSWEVTGAKEIFRKLRQYKPQYTDKQCEMAFDILCGAGLCTKNGEQHG